MDFCEKKSRFHKVKPEKWPSEVAPDAYRGSPYPAGEEQSAGRPVGANSAPLQQGGLLVINVSQDGGVGDPIPSSIYIFHPWIMVTTGLVSQVSLPENGGNQLLHL